MSGPPERLIDKEKLKKLEEFTRLQNEISEVYDERKVAFIGEVEPIDEVKKLEGEKRELVGVAIRKQERINAFKDYEERKERHDAFMKSYGKGTTHIMRGGRVQEAPEAPPIYQPKVIELEGGSASLDNKGKFTRKFSPIDNDIGVLTSEGKYVRKKRKRSP